MRAVVVVYYKWLLPIFKHFYKLNYPLDVCEIKNPWSNNVIEYLKKQDENILLIMDDYIIKDFDEDIIRKANELCQGNVGCVRVYPYNSRSENLKNGEYPNDAPYSMNLQIAVWQPKYLLEILREGEDPWKAETEGSKRMAKNSMKILWSDKPGITYTQGGCMVKGKPIPEEFNWINDNW